MDNRENILNCALQLFAVRGYDAVGVQEIVTQAGVTKPTLYHYFKSKHGLLHTLLDTYFRELHSTTQAAALYQGDLPQTLERIAEAYFHFAQDHRAFYRMQLAMWFAPPNSESFKAVVQHNNQQQRCLETLFIQAAEDHGNMKERHRAYAATFLGMLNTYISLALNDYAQLDESLIYKANHQFMHGIFS